MSRQTIAVSVKASKLTARALAYLSHSEQCKLVESCNGITEQSRRSLKAEP